MDFEFQDFAIVEAPQADVVKAIARMALADDLPTDDLEPVAAFGPKGSDAAATVAEMFPDAPRSSPRRPLAAFRAALASVRAQARRRARSAGSG